MPKIHTRVFRVNSVSPKISDRYTSLGWFFNDGPEHQLTYPAGLFYIDATRELVLHVEYQPDSITIEAILTYLDGLGISAIDLGPYTPSWFTRVLQVALWPFAAMFIGIALTLLRLWDYRQRKNNHKQ